MTNQESKNKSKESPDNVVIKRLTILVLGLLALFMIFQLCVFFADTIRILTISILFSYLFINLVDWLSKYLRSRVAAALIVYAVVLAGSIVGVLVLLPAVTTQIVQLISTTYEQLPNWVASLTQAMIPIEQKLHSVQIELRTIDILNGFVSSIPKIEAGMLFTHVSDVAVSTMASVFYGLSIFVISFYFLLDGYQIQSSLIRFFPKEHRLWWQKVMRETDKSLQSFFRSQIILGLGFGAFMILVFLILGVHYALLLGIVLGIWEIIPVIGPPIGSIPALISVGIHGMDNLPIHNKITQFLIILIIFNGFQWLKDNFVAPRYIGNVIGLHPITIFIAIMIGAKLDGMSGVIFALPAACVINVLMNHFRTNHQTKA